jgi:5,10-methylenetetrahydromethanopterin reductase
MHMELWTLTHSNPDHIAGAARRAEAAGWDGLMVVDSQNLAGDSYVALTLAAGATSKLCLGTGVTNTITRHPAVTASAAMSVNEASGGRMRLGLGRGDSALAHLGRSPARFAGFAQYVRALQRYLCGEPVAFAEIPMDDRLAAPVEDLELADHPSESVIRWRRHESKVPLEIAATGPKVIGLAGAEADRVMFTLGAVPDRIRWGMELARKSAQIAAKAAPKFGSYVNMVCHPDKTVARQLVRGGLTTFARFAVMHGDVAGPVSEDQSKTLQKLHDGYDMTAHTRADSQQAEIMSDSFVDAYAIAGPPDYCIERLKELETLGIEKVTISGPTAGVDREEARRAMTLLDAEILPAFAG